MVRASSRTRGSNAPIGRDVKPRDTSLRSCACRGSSITIRFGNGERACPRARSPRRSRSVPGSWAAHSTSSNRESAQKPRSLVVVHGRVVTERAVHRIGITLRVGVVRIEAHGVIVAHLGWSAARPREPSSNTCTTRGRGARTMAVTMVEPLNAAPEAIPPPEEAPVDGPRSRRPRPARGAPRGPQPGPAGGGERSRRSAARRRRSGLGQDARAHEPDRVPHRRAARLPVRVARDHVHQQGRGRDEGARRRRSSGRWRGACG